MAKDFSQGLRIWARGADWPVGPGERHQDSEGTFGSKSNRDHCGGYSRGSWEVAWGLRALPVLPAQNPGSRIKGFSWRVWGGARGSASTNCSPQLTARTQPAEDSQISHSFHSGFVMGGVEWNAQHINTYLGSGRRRHKADRMQFGLCECKLSCFGHV